MNYKTFNYNYNTDVLYELYNTGIKSEYLCYKNVDLSDVDMSILPYMDVFERELSISEYGLAELCYQTGMHISPKNNGLIMFPVHGLINFTFVSGESIDITQPTIINGSVLHNYYPKYLNSVFFAIKIPKSISYEECCTLPKN